MSTDGHLKHPSYPTGSFNYLRPSWDSETSQTDGQVKLDIVIIGAGVAGLSAAIALKRDGHNVVIYESTHTLSEVRTPCLCYG